ncbi:lysine methyltransferase [Skeletonema marinoi]|uniref:Lysine methyltransferase n=1 Tax=Skeletonema marinoi TaxID=267567 RepID=A0AAD8Y6M9_9STRA|nr:lysine methyltransferase [Skeletonema marinoi]
MTFTSQQYLHALAPIDKVIDAFIEDEKSSNTDVWSIQSQGRFADLLASSPDASPDLSNTDIKIECDDIEFLPSEKYVQKLMKRYTTRLEMEGKELEDNNLASLVCHFSMSQISKLPDPADSCLLTYQVPCRDLSRQMKHDLLRIRIYPHHNDVGVAKVWEAGACLAEYLMQYPECVRGLSCIEIGAGVGLTGFIAAAVGAKSVHMTDYTDATLENLIYNVSINNEWLGDRGIDTDTVSIGNLEWGEYAEHDCCSHPADVLIAADVVYTVECIPDLVATVSKFLSSGSSTNAKVALFATTYRNRSTFALFERELEKKRIMCAYKSQDKMPYVFPCYFNQPRSDVRICTMTLSE